MTLPLKPPSMGASVRFLRCDGAESYLVPATVVACAPDGSATLTYLLPVAGAPHPLPFTAWSAPYSVAPAPNCWST